jgi:hypothetical protein
VKVAAKRPPVALPVPAHNLHTASGASPWPRKLRESRTGDWNTEHRVIRDNSKLPKIATTKNGMAVTASMLAGLALGLLQAGCAALHTTPLMMPETPTGSIVKPSRPEVPDRSYDRCLELIDRLIVAKATFTQNATVNGARPGLTDDEMRDYFSICKPLVADPEPDS